MRNDRVPNSLYWGILAGYAAGYFFHGICALFAACFAYARWVTETSATSLWAVGLCVLVTAVVWWSAQAGQRLSRGQMGVLKEVLGEE